MKPSQVERIKTKLARDSYVTRNECLRQFPAITRLGARIQDLEDKGYVFRTEDTGRDFIYHLISAPTTGNDTRRTTEATLSTKES